MTTAPGHGTRAGSVGLRSRTLLRRRDMPWADIAELDDAGRPVRLAGAPDDLARIIRALDARTAPAVQPEPSA
jgi:hypothetical protein